MNNDSVLKYYLEAAHSYYCLAIHIILLRIFLNKNKSVVIYEILTLTGPLVEGEFVEVLSSSLL